MAATQQASPATGAASPTSTVEGRAREYLASGRFRKARDEIKPLVKIDRARYLPLLIEANKGLVREMLAKGQVSEAQQVIAYMKTIASPAEVCALELESSAKSDDPQTVVSKALPLLTDALAEPEKRRLADRLVLAFQPVPAGSAGSPEIAAELQAVHEAFAAVAASQFERAQELLRPLAQSSVFSHWKLFIKGLVSFYGGEIEKAARCFAGLPPDSVPAKASQPYLLSAGKWQSPKGTHQPSEAVVEGAARLAGLAGMARVLARAEQSWKAGRYAGSYQIVRGGVAGFPSATPDALGALSEFYFKAVFSLPREEADEYGEFFEELVYTDNTKSALERLLSFRLLALLAERHGYLPEVEDDWKEFLQLHKQLHGANPRLESLVYGRLGSGAAAPRAPSAFSFESALQKEDADGAITALEKSIALDPSNLDAHLNLCRAYEIRHMSSERNRLLDAMTERFPASKAVLVQAGRGCLDREAYTKGLDYLQTAWELDRLDPAIPQLMVSAKVKIARQHYEKERLEKGRQAFRDLAGFQLDNPTDLIRGRWCLLAQEGLLEMLHGERPRGDELLVQARVASPATAAFWFFAQLAYFDFDTGDPPPFPFKGELAEAKKQGTIAAATLLLRIYNQWRGTAESSDLFAAEGFLRQYLQKAVKQAFTLAEARAFADQLNSHTVFNEELARVVKGALKQDKKEPFFRLFHLLLNPPARLPMFWKPSSDPKVELPSIIEEATRRGDQTTAALARQCLDRFKLAGPMPLPEETDTWDEEEDDPDEAPSGRAPRGMAMMEELIIKIASASDAEIRELRRTLPRDIPKEVFDALVAGSQAIKIPPQRTPFVPIVPKRDPNQMDLF